MVVGMHGFSLDICWGSNMNFAEEVFKGIKGGNTWSTWYLVSGSDL